MKAEIGKIYTDFSTYDQKEKCLTIFTGRWVKPRFERDELPEIILYENTNRSPGIWMYSTAEDMEIVGSWEPASDYIRDAIISLFTNGIVEDRSVA